MFKLPRLRFSLRMLLLAVAVVGTWLGWYTNRVHEQKRAVAALRQLGSLAYDYEVTTERQPRVPRWMCDLVGIDWFCQVERVNLRTSSTWDDRITDTDLEQLRRLPGLRWLQLVSNLPLTDSQMRMLGKLESLDSLIISAPSIGAAGLCELRNLRHLTYLDITPPIGDEGLRHVSQLTSLEQLEISSDDITMEGFKPLRALTSLRTLTCWGLPPEVFADLRRAIPAIWIDDGLKRRSERASFENDSQSFP